MTLQQKAYSGVRWTASSYIIRAILQFIQLIVLARLLAPSDFGLLAIVLAIMAFLQIFADAGISNAIIHYQKITKNQLSSLYWLNVMVSTFIALIVISLSGWVATWYNEPMLQFLLIISSLSLIINSLAQQLRIIAQKELRFAGLAKVELLSAIIGFMITILLAFLGMGVYSIVIGTVITAVMGTIFAWLWLSKGWRPRRQFQLNETYPFLKFGMYMIGNNLSNTLNSQIDVLLGGRLLGMQSVGLYSIPKDLSLRIGGIINPIITQVGLPVMAKKQDDILALKRIYLYTLRMTASINFPLYILLFIFSAEIIPLFLGEKWLAAIPLLQLFAIWGLLRSIGNPVGSLLLALGKVDIAFKWDAITLFIIPPFIFIGSQFGVIGVAWSMVLVKVILYIPSWYFLVRPLCRVNFMEYSWQLILPLLLSLFSGGICYSAVMGIEYDLVRLIIGVVVCAITYLIASYYFNQLWLDSMLKVFGKKLKVVK